jgi:hypothetical protein
MSQPLYILLRGDDRKPSRNEDGQHVIGVVSDSKVADKFYAAQTPGDVRDVVMFMLDDVPELSGVMTEPDLPEPTEAPAAAPATPASGPTKEQWDMLKDIKRQQTLQSIELQKRLEALKKRKQNSR